MQLPVRTNEGEDEKETRPKRTNGQNERKTKRIATPNNRKRTFELESLRTFSVSSLPVRKPLANGRRLLFNLEVEKMTKMEKWNKFDFHFDFGFSLLTYFMLRYTNEIRKLKNQDRTTLSRALMALFYTSISFSWLPTPGLANSEVPCSQ